MSNSTPSNQIKRRPVNLTIREDIMNLAKSLELNMSKAAEAGIISAIKFVKSEQWLKTNKDAILAHNHRIQEDGILLEPNWDN